MLSVKHMSQWPLLKKGRAGRTRERSSKEQLKMQGALMPRNNIAQQRVTLPSHFAQGMRPNQMLNGRGRLQSLA